LTSAIRDSLSQAGLAPDEVQVSLAESQPAVGSGSRQILVTITPAADSQSAQPQAAGANSGATVSNDPVEILKNALSAAGLDPNRFSLTESSEVVNYPGGSYVNHLITADFGGGLRESYGVELMLRNPQVTVVEIQRALSSLTSV